jgi:hypothetical protein
VGNPQLENNSVEVFLQLENNGGKEASTDFHAAQISNSELEVELYFFSLSYH